MSVDLAVQWGHALEEASADDPGLFEEMVEAWSAGEQALTFFVDGSTGDLVVQWTPIPAASSS